MSTLTMVVISSFIVFFVLFIGFFIGFFIIAFRRISGMVEVQSRVKKYILERLPIKMENLDKSITRIETTISELKNQIMSQSNRKS